MAHAWKIKYVGTAGVIGDLYFGKLQRTPHFEPDDFQGFSKVLVEEMVRVQRDPQLRTLQKNPDSVGSSVVAA